MNTESMLIEHTESPTLMRMQAVWLVERMKRLSASDRASVTATLEEEASRQGFCWSCGGDLQPPLRICHCENDE